jgi:hypothetical protein
MKSHLSARLAAAAGVAVILLLALWGAPRAASPAPSLASAQATSTRTATATATSTATATATPTLVVLEGGYSGSVQLDWVLVGVLSDTLHTPTPIPTLGPKTPTPAASPRPRPNLGEMDLGVLLRSSDSYTVTGYIDLSASQVFTTEHTIMVTPAPLPARVSGAHAPASSIGQTQAIPTATATATATSTPAAVKLAVGPRVTGVLTVLTDGITLTLLSDQFPLKTSTGLNLLRQFRLVGRKVERNGSIFDEESDQTSTPTMTPMPAGGGWISDVYEGEYRETFWNLGATPVTLIGRFRLVQPVFVTPTPTPTVTPTPTRTATPTRTPTGRNK